MNCILTTAYLAPIDYYCQLRRADTCLLEVFDTYQKQSYRNRCLIASPSGPQALTIPVVKPENGKLQMKDIRISDHGNWRHLHWNALQTAYSRSPFFEYYADDFAPFYQRKWDFLVDFNEALQEVVCQLIDFQPRIVRTESYQTQYPDVVDLRERIHPRQPALNSDFPTYYQVFAHKQGFLPNLSIVDLLFNMGPESLLLL